KIFYCGHSMGGILGYGHAGMHDDLEGLITIGSPSELGSDFFVLRILAHLEPALTAGVDALLLGLNARVAAQRGLKLAARALARLPGVGAIASRLAEAPSPRKL